VNLSPQSQDANLKLGELMIKVSNWQLPLFSHPHISIWTFRDDVASLESVAKNVKFVFSCEEGVHSNKPEFEFNVAERDTVPCIW